MQSVADRRIYFYLFLTITTKISFHHTIYTQTLCSRKIRKKKKVQDMTKQVGNVPLLPFKPFSIKRGRMCSLKEIKWSKTCWGWSGCWYSYKYSTKQNTKMSAISIAIQVGNKFQYTISVIKNSFNVCYQSNIQMRWIGLRYSDKSLQLTFLSQLYIVEQTPMYTFQNQQEFLMSRFYFKWYCFPKQVDFRRSSLELGLVGKSLLECAKPHSIQEYC